MLINTTAEGLIEWFGDDNVNHMLQSSESPDLHLWEIFGSRSSEVHLIRRGLTLY